MITLVIGQMHFKQLQMLINLLHQSQLLGQRVDGADASATDGPDALRHFIVEVATLEHGLGLVGKVLRLEPALNSLLAMTENLAVEFPHSKCPFWLRC